jgi:hypothetical protein
MTPFYVSMGGVGVFRISFQKKLTERAGKDALPSRHG